MSTTNPGITIVGLGPGDGRLLTRQAWDVISQATTITLRTARHPAVADLPAGVEQISFDYIYDSAADFAEVYQQIADAVLTLGAQPGGIIYAVPGDPHVGESTVTRICRAAKQADIPVEILSGVSFVEPVMKALGVDAMSGLQLFDAIEIAGYLYPPVNPDLPLLLGQVYSRLLAGDLKLSLMAVYPEEHEVTLVHEAGMATEVVEHEDRKSVV